MRSTLRVFLLERGTFWVWGDEERGGKGRIEELGWDDVKRAVCVDGVDRGGCVVCCGGGR